MYMQKLTNMNLSESLTNSLIKFADVSVDFMEQFNEDKFIMLLDSFVSDLNDLITVKMMMNIILMANQNEF